MKFMIIWESWQRIIEANDFEDAFNQAYDNHTGYSHLVAIIKIEESTF